MKQFFITFFANLAALLFVFGGPMLLLFILILASFSFSSKTKHLITLERGSILVMDMSLNVTGLPRTRHRSQSALLRPWPGHPENRHPAQHDRRPAKGRER